MKLAFLSAQVVITCAFAFNMAGAPAPGSLDPSFAPQILGDGQVNTLIVQTNNQLIVGGAFTVVNGQPRTNLARLNFDGTLDPSFLPNPGIAGTNQWVSFLSSSISVMALQPDGKIVMGGLIRENNMNVWGMLFRFNSDGNMDETFVSPVMRWWGIQYYGGYGGYGPEPDPSLTQVLLQSNGQILVSGNFILMGGFPCNGVARLNTSGTLDTNFNPQLPRYAGGLPTIINTLAVQQDGKILIGGYYGHAFAYASAYPMLVRVNDNGSLDPGFWFPENIAYPYGPSVKRLLVRNSRILAGLESGYGGTLIQLNPDGSMDYSFGTFNLGGNINSLFEAHDTKNRFYCVVANARGVYRFNNNGWMDATFQPTFAGGPVNAAAASTNGQVFVAGTFNQINGTPSRVLASLDTDGSVDGQFQTAVKTRGFAKVLAASEGKSYLIGVSPFTTVNGETRYGLARLDADGNLDPSFDPGDLLDAGYYYNPIATVDASGKLLLAIDSWALKQPNAYSGCCIIRYNLDGSIDETFFADGWPGNPSALAVQQDGKVLLGWNYPPSGYFNSLIRLMTNGFLDDSFNAASVYGVRTLAARDDGNIVFTGATRDASLEGIVGCLRPDGSVDSSFQSSIHLPNYESKPLICLTDNTAVVYGYASSEMYAYGSLYHLNIDGSFDPDWKFPLSSAGVNAMSVQADGKLVVGGVFRMPNGEYWQTLLRFQPNGEWDANFAAPFTNSSFMSLAVDEMGKILVSGGLVSSSGDPRYVARLYGGESEASPPTFVFQPSNHLALEGQMVSLFAPAKGFPVPAYQWYFDGAVLSGATNSVLQLTPATTNNAGEYFAVVQNASGMATSTVARVSILEYIALEAALNTTNVSWISSFAWPDQQLTWYGQRAVTHDGHSAAQTFLPAAGSASVLSTILQGRGTLSFWWKVSSEPGYDFLQFYVDNVLQASISGEVDWEQHTFAIKGAQIVEWSYAKDGSLSAGSDAGWLDEVSFMPTPLEPFSLIPIGFSSNGKFQLLFSGEVGRTYRIQTSDDLVQWNDIGTVAGTGGANRLLEYDSAWWDLGRFYRAVTP